jgi:S-(hydroxymethyl)glutathione dehydrogenase/alcohol dehydrogenase
MKAVVLLKAGENFQLEIKDIPKPKPKKGEVLIKVHASGVCHTDLHIALGEIPFPLPAVLGHEVTGTVEEIGEDVEEFSKGDEVLAPFIFPCGNCRYCKMGREDLCEKFYIFNRLKGVYYDGETRLKFAEGYPIYMYSMASWSEYCVVPANSLFKVPKNLPLDKLASLGCAMMTAFGACRNASLKNSELVAVFGAGGVGLNIIQIASRVYHAKVIAIDIDDKKLEHAKKIGAEFQVNSKKEDPLDAIKTISQEGVDASFEAIGNPITISQAIKSVRAGGRAVIVGLSKVKNEASFEINWLVRRGVQIIGSYGGIPSKDIPLLLDLLSRQIIKIEEIITLYKGIDQIPRALEDLRERRVIGRPICVISS